MPNSMRTQASLAQATFADDIGRNPDDPPIEAGHDKLTMTALDKMLLV
jgi:hypothetical protein